MSTQPASGFAPNMYLFQANAAALSVRLRRPEEVIHTEGSACLMGIGGRAAASGKDIRLHHGILTADSYSTEVTGDFVDLKAAAALTESHGDQVSKWRYNTLEIETTAACTVNGFRSINFENAERKEGPSLRIGQFEFKMTGRHRRRLGDQIEITFDKLGFNEVSINGKALRVVTRGDIFDSLPTYNSFREEYNTNKTFRKEFGHMVYRPAPDSCSSDPDQLYERRGFYTVTVVNKIEWADPQGCDTQIGIAGHSVTVPGYGTIYFGEMTVSPNQRRLHMVRITLGCPDGGDKGGGLGCPNGHDHP